MVEGENSEIIPPSGTPGGKYVRGAMNAVGGAIPFLGGVFSAAAGFWSEAEQESLIAFFSTGWRCSRPRRPKSNAR